MRFLRLWFLLASAYLASRLVSSYWISGNFGLDARFWTHVALVPLVQAAALAPLLLRRGKSRPPRAIEPPPPIC
jgi:hypothetical protein